LSRVKPFAPFAIARLPRIVFGDGALADLPKEAARFGRTGLIVTGARSLRATPLWPALLDAVRAADIACHDLAVPGEPSPELVDEAVAAFAGKGIDVVIGIGGGSALDAAKAIAGLLPHGHSVIEHLEGVGRWIYCANGPSGSDCRAFRHTACQGTMSRSSSPRAGAAR
jgi:alcohol dehydrogenase class IV